MKFDEKEVIDSFDEEFSRKKKSADQKKTNGSIPMPKITPLIFVVGALVICALSFLVLKLMKKENAVPAMTPTAEISLAGVPKNTEAVVVINDSSTVIPLASVTATTGNLETGSGTEEENPSRSDGSSEYSQAVSSTETQTAVPTMAPVSESDGSSEYSQFISSVQTQSVVSPRDPVSELDSSSDYSQAVSSTATQTVIPTLNGSSESFSEMTQTAAAVQNMNMETADTAIGSAGNRESSAPETVNNGVSVGSESVEPSSDTIKSGDSTPQQIRPVVSGNKTVNVNNVPVRLTEDTEISVPETETPVSASNGDISPWTALSTPQPTDVPVFEILSAEEIRAISSAALSPTEEPASSDSAVIEEQTTDDPASSAEVLPSPTATQPIPTETPVPTQTPMPTPTPDTRNWFEKMIDKVFRRESATPTAAIPTETEAAESLPPVERTEETPAVVAIGSVPSLNPEHQPDEDPINAPVSVRSETQSDFDSDSSSLENRESPSAGIPSAPVSPAQSDNAQIATLLPAEAGKSLDPEPVYSPVDQNENHRNEGISDEKTVAAIGEKQSGSVSDEKSETGTAQIALPKAQSTGNTEAPLESEDVEAKAAAASTPNWSPDMNYATAVVMNLSDSDIISLRDMGILDSELIDDGPNETAIPTRLPETPEPTEEEVHATIVPVTRTKQPRAGKTQIAVSTSRTKTPVSKQAELPKTGGAEDLNLPLYAGLLAMLSAIVLILRALRKKG